MDNNNTANGIALDPNQMAPQDSSPLVQTGSTQPTVVDITPRDFSTPDPLSAPVPPMSTPVAEPMVATPVAPVMPTPVVTESPMPVVAPTSSIVDITPSADPLSAPVPPMSTPVAEPMVTTPIAPAAPTQDPAPGSLVDIISASVPQPVAPDTTTTAPTPSAPVVPQVPVLQTNPLTEDPNAVNTIG